MRRKVIRSQPHGPANRGAVSWQLTEEKIKERLKFCADPDVHGPQCVCMAYKQQGALR
jgi:hypothetical protein